MKLLTINELVKKITDKLEHLSIPYLKAEAEALAIQEAKAEAKAQRKKDKEAKKLLKKQRKIYKPQSDFARLVLAIQDGRYERVISLLENTSVNVNGKTMDGLTPLHFAMMYGHENIALILIEAGAKASVTTTGYLPVNMARYNCPLTTEELPIKPIVLP